MWKLNFYFGKAAFPTEENQRYGKEIRTLYSFYKKKTVQKIRYLPIRLPSMLYIWTIEIVLELQKKKKIYNKLHVTFLSKRITKTGMSFGKYCSSLFLAYQMKCLDRALKRTTAFFSQFTTCNYSQHLCQSYITSAVVMSLNNKQINLLGPIHIGLTLIFSTSSWLVLTAQTQSSLMNVPVSGVSSSGWGSLSLTVSSATELLKDIHYIIQKKFNGKEMFKN